MNYETDLNRILAAFLVGASVGAAVITGQYYLALDDGNGPGSIYDFWISSGRGIFQIAFFVWLIGLIAFGGPVWLVLHRMKCRQYYWGLIGGSVVPFFVLYMWTTTFLTGQSGVNSLYSQGGFKVSGGELTPFGWKMAFLNSMEYAVIGAVIGLVIWRIAYRKSG